MTESKSLYDSDLVAWSDRNAELLRAGRFSEVDIENVAEEIESLGRSNKHQLWSRLMLLCMHLLKWQYQPDRRSPSWQATIRVQRRDAAVLLEESPSLKGLLDKTLTKAYADGRDLATIETGIWIDDFPLVCPWTVEEILSESFWPGE